MKIYPPSVMVDDQEYFQLSVINQWDFKTKPICFRDVGKNLISYCLYKRFKTSGTILRNEMVTTLSNDMKNELINMGYIVNE